jgi:hypothetical protein
MIERFFRMFHQIPMAWTAFAIAMLLFGLTRMIPGSNWLLPDNNQSRLDLAYIEALQADIGTYSVLGEDHQQTMGAHVLPQYLRAVLSLVAHDANRAGVWLSLVGVLASLGGMYSLSRRILPLRGFCIITMVAMAGVGSLHYAVGPDPSISLGMAFILWGFAFFASALDREYPHRALIAAVFFGLAGYIRIELSLLQIPLSLYLFLLAIFPSLPQKRRMPLGGMAVGSLLIVVLMLWPLIHNNMLIAKSPILPGPDARMILGAQFNPSSSSLPIISRIVFGFKTLLLNPIGPGIFAGLLWPLGMGISLVTHRDKSIPLFWLPMVFVSVTLLTMMSFMTGLQSYQECLQIITPILLPFSVLPIIFVVFRWFQSKPRGFMESRKVWLLVALGVYLMVQIPHAFRKALNLNGTERDSAVDLIEGFNGQDKALLEASILTDMPDVLLAAGKTDVYGLGGETDWEVMSSKYSDGSLFDQKLLNYIATHRIGLLHFSDVNQEALVLRMQQLIKEGYTPAGRSNEGQEATTILSINRVPQFNSPHLVYRIEFSPASGS